VWRAVSGVVPGIAIVRERRRIGHALFGNKPLQGVEPVPVISLAGIGIPRRLRALDFRAERLRPFRPGEQAALVERKRHGEGLGFPRLAKDGAFVVARNARNGLSGLPRRQGIDLIHSTCVLFCKHHAGSR
jgi:hypothetical protein